MESDLKLMHNQLVQERQKKIQAYLLKDKYKGELEEKTVQLKELKEQLCYFQKNHETEIEIYKSKIIQLVKILNKSDEISSTNMKSTTTDLANIFTLKAGLLHSRYLRDLSTLESSLTLKYQSDIKELNEGWKYQMDILQSQYEDIKIEKEESIQRQYDLEMKLEKQMNLYENLFKESKSTLQNLKRTSTELRDLRQKVPNLNQMEKELQLEKNQNKDLKDQMEKLQRQNGTLKEKLNKISNERNELYREFEHCVEMMRNQGNAKKLALNEKIHALRSQIKNKENGDDSGNFSMDASTVK